MKPTFTQIKITNRYPKDWLKDHGIAEVMLLSYIDKSETTSIGDNHEDWGYEGQTIEVFGVDNDGEQLDMPKTAPLYPRTKIIDGHKIDSLHVIENMGHDSWASEWACFPLTEEHADKMGDKANDFIEDLIQTLKGDYRGND